MAILFAHLTGSNRGRVDQFASTIERVRLGRAADCEVRASHTDTIVSSHHAVVSLTPRGYVVQDLASRNGTLVNGQMIERAPISAGDTVQLGLGGPQIRFDVLAEPETRISEADSAVLAVLQDAADAIGRYMSAYLNDLGLTASRFNTLQAIRSDPAHAVTQNELGTRLTVTGASITGVLDRLERDNLVARESHPTDRRANVVRLTDDGEALIQHAANLHSVRTQELLAVLDDAEKATLLELLARLAEAARKKS